MSSMFTHQSTLRVRYAETDQMGVVYYGNYATYFEVARVEALRSMGITYKSLEEKGIMMPVLEYSIKYFRPAYYDDLIDIELQIPERPVSRIRFDYISRNPAGTTINQAQTTLVFVNAQTKRPMAAPEVVNQALAKYFN